MSLEEKLDSKKVALTVLRMSLDAAMWAGLYGLEGIREDALHPKKGAGHFLRKGHERGDPKPWITPENVPAPVYNCLNHGGDVLEGFYISAAVYWALTPFGLRENTKLAVAGAAAVGFTALYEMGIIHAQRPDPWDIPASAIGAGLYAVSNVLLRKV
jgi:hypothetical protein